MPLPSQYWSGIREIEQTVQNFKYFLSTDLHSPNGDAGTKIPGGVSLMRVPACLFRALRLVAATHLPFQQGRNFAFDHLLAQGRQVVDKNVSVKMVKLMLHNAC